MFSLIFILFVTLFQQIAADCPISNYPQRTVLGFIDAQFNNDPQLHGQTQSYQYPLQSEFEEEKINVALGIVSLQINSHNQLNFDIQHVSSPSVDKIKFKVKVINQNNGWMSLRFNFLASQSFLFKMESLNIESFSVGLEEGSYAVYRPIPNIKQFADETVIKIFLSGVNIEGNPLDEEYQRILDKYNSFKQFSTNKELIQYFRQAVIDKKSLKFALENTKITSHLLSFSIKTNTILKSISFTYIVFSNSIYSEKHNQVNGDFSLLYGEPHEITGLKNMEVLLTGLNIFSIPRDQEYEFSLSFEKFLGRSSFDVSTTHEFLELGFAFIAFELKQRHVCDNCEDSPLIFQKFCVSECPRSYSEVKRLGSTYCQRCSINDLKVVDPKTHQCVCARRHFLNSSKNACSPCSYDCMTCSQPDQCDTCDNNLLQTKRTQNSQGRCECPSTGYYDNKDKEDIVCQKCHSSCKTCYGPRIHDCQTCESDKELDQYNHCLCKDNYIQTADGSCVCEPPYQIKNGFCVDENEVCDQNQQESFVNGVRFCVCNSGYIQVSNQCIKCGDNESFDEEDLACQCIEGTVFENGRCVPCGNNKVFDPVNKKCVCKPNSFETENRQCVTCPSKMVYENGECQCIFNYFLNSAGKCEKCVRDTDGPKCRRIIL